MLSRAVIDWLNNENPSVKLIYYMTWEVLVQLIEFLPLFGIREFEQNFLCNNLLRWNTVLKITKVNTSVALFKYRV